MLCWNCNEPASGVCAFCGRAVCKKHAAEMPAIVTIYIGDKQVPKAIVVSGALHWYVDRDAAGPEHLHLGLVVVHARDQVPHLGKAGTGDEADVARPDDRQLHQRFSIL